MAETTKVTLKQLIDISRTLRNIVCRSFGPRCQTTLLATSTGQIMVTTDGIKILKSLNIGHPIGRLIVQAVSAHHQVHADSVKTFILYLCEFLYQLDALQEDSPTNLISVSKSIPQFIIETLPKCLENFKSNGLLVLNSESYFPLELDHRITDFVRTTLAPNLRKNQVKLISNLFSSVIMNGSNSLTKIPERADLFCDFFEYLHIQATGSYADSKIVSGILLKPFSCNFHDVSKSSLNFVILRNSIEGNKTSEPEELVRISSVDSLNASIMSPINVAQGFLKKLNSLSINLILICEKIPQFVVNLCRKYDISVIECLDDQEINLVELLSSTSSLSSVFDEISERNIGQTVSCERIKFGKQVYTKIHFSNCLYIKSFVLCAPTEGLAHELSSLIYKSFKSVQASAARTGASLISFHLVSTPTDSPGTKVVCIKEMESKVFESSFLIDSYSSSEAKIPSSQITNTVEEKTVNSATLCTEVNISGAQIVDSGTQSVDSGTQSVDSGTQSVDSGTQSVDSGTQSVDSGTQSVDSGTQSVDSGTQSVDSGTQSVDSGTQSVDSGTQSVDSGTQSVDSVDMCPRKFDSSANINVPEIEKTANSRPASTLSILFLPAGGYFEFQLAKYIRQSTENFKSAEFGDVGKLIFETLLAVPRNLHSNLSEKNFNEKRHYLEILQKVLNNDASMCLNSTGHVYCPSEDCHTLESWNLKIATLCNVLQLIQQLLRLDLIIGVKTLKPE